MDDDCWHWREMSKEPPPKDGTRLEFWCNVWECPVFVAWKVQDHFGEDTSYWSCEERMLEELGFFPDEQASHWRLAYPLPGPVVG